MQEVFRSLPGLHSKFFWGKGALKLVHKGYNVFIFDRIDTISKKHVLLRLKKRKEKKGFRGRLAMASEDSILLGIRKRSAWCIIAASTVQFS